MKSTVYSLITACLILVTGFPPCGHAQELFLAPLGYAELYGQDNHHNQNKKDIIAIVLEVYGRKKLEGLTIRQAAIRTRIKLSKLKKYFNKNPGALEKYGIIEKQNKKVLNEEFIAWLLKKHGRNHLEGLSISQVAKLLNIKQHLVSNYFLNHPEDIHTYGISKGYNRRRKNIIPGKLLKQYGRKKLKDLSIMQAAIRMDIPLEYLRSYFNKYPPQLKKYGIIKNKFRNPIELYIAFLFEKYGKEKLEGLIISETAEFLDIAYEPVKRYFKDHEGEQEKHGITNIPYDSIPFILEQFGESQLEGLNISGVSQLIGVNNSTLARYFNNNSDKLNRYGIIKYKGQCHKSHTSKTYKLLEKYKDKIKGCTISQAARIIRVDRRTLWIHLKNHPQDYKRYGIINPKKPSKISITSKDLRTKKSL